MENKRTLVKTLGMSYVVIFVIANILGSGVYKKIAPMADELHSTTWILAAWVAGGIITLFGALSNAEIAGMMADTGGDYVYLRKIYNRFFGFLYGWSLFTVIQTATISSLAYVFAQSLNSFISLPPVLSSLQDFSIGGVFLPFQDFNVKLVAILLILLLTGLNISGLKNGALLSKGIVFLVCAGLFLIIIFGLSSGETRPLNLFSHTDLASGTVTFSGFYTAMLASFWAYQGWVSVGYIGGEIKNANKAIPRGIVIGILIVIVIYVLVNLTYMSLLSVDELSSVHSSRIRIAAIEAVRQFWGTGGVMFISLLIMITTLGCTHASILTGARPYYAMAAEGSFFRSVSKVNKTNVPANSLLLQGIWASVLVLSGTFDQLTDMVVFAQFIFYGAIAVGVFILRKRMPDAHRPFKSWGYPVIPAIYILFCIGLFLNTIITRPREAVIGLILIIGGLPVYYFLDRNNRKISS